MIDIDLVELADPANGNAAFDLPKTGHVDVVSFRVAAWFRRPRGAPVGSVRFTLVASDSPSSSGFILREINPQERTDVPCRPSEICLGFDAYVDGVLLPRTFRIQIRYRGETGEDWLFGEIHGRRTMLGGGYVPKIQPIIVFHAGRMGSTAMMQALRAHPDILVDGRHPYEVGAAEYFSRASSILLSTPGVGDRWIWNLLGPNPYLTPDFQSYESIESNLASLSGPVADFARARIDCWYRTVGARTNRSTAMFFAEKAVWPQASSALLWLYPTVKLIFLTRDPRDVFRSARDFNAKRGIPAFGQESVESDEEWIDLRGGWLSDIVDVFDHHPEDNRLHVRFEDFVDDPIATLSRVCTFLEIAVSDPVLSAMKHAVEEETPQANSHRTSSPGQEVGRWRHDLTDEHANRVVRRSRDYMRRFGYDADLDRAADMAGRGPSEAPVPSRNAANAAPKNDPRVSTFVSYSTNFEDVILRRLFPAQRTGFYVDVGAADPTFENDTKAFYDAGWTGINIEPNEAFFALLSAQRPRDRNLRTAVSDRSGTIDYYDVVGTGLSTCDKTFADLAGRQGYQVVQRSVPVATLGDILNEINPLAIDFLKIDVEGLEEEVLRGNDWARFRPSVILLEATFPESSERRPTGIREYLADRRYAWKYFDGLNDFYVAEEFSFPPRSFESPPNIFDHVKLRRVAELEDRIAVLTGEVEARNSAERTRQRDATERLSETERRLEDLNIAFAKLEALARAAGNARDEAAQYAHSLERARADAEQYAKSLQDALEGRDATLKEAETYIASLKAALARLEEARENGDRPAIVSE